MPCTPPQGVQLPVQNVQYKLPYGSLSRLSRQTGLSERTIREYLSGCDKQPRFRTVALLLLGQGFGWEDIQQQMFCQFPFLALRWKQLGGNRKSVFPTIIPYDPRRALLPSFTLISLSNAIDTIIDNAALKTKQRRTAIISEISNLAQCSQSSVKKLLAGYCDCNAETQSRFEISWNLIVASAIVCDCSELDLQFLLSTAFPDLALAFWLHSSYSAEEGYSTAAAEIENYMQRIKTACRQDKGLHNCNQCRKCNFPKIELVVRSANN